MPNEIHLLRNKIEAFSIPNSRVFCGFLLLLCLLGTTVDVFEWHSILKSPNESSSINHDQTSTTIRDEEIPFQASLQPYHKSTTDMSAPLVSEQARVPSVSSKIPAGR